MASPQKSFKFATVATLAAVLGALVGYYIGHFAWIGQNNEYTNIAYFFFDVVPGFSVDSYKNMQDLINEWGILIIFVAGFTPMPFELITIVSGVFDTNIYQFIMGAIIGRSARYFLIAFLIWKYGEKVRVFIDKYFNLVAFGLVAFAVSVFLIIKYFL